MPSKSLSQSRIAAADRSLKLTVFGSSVLLSLACAPVLAQDALGNGQALGGGNALDANPGQYGTGNYQRASLVDELRFRNSIATGNAPGGLSFRGDIGYRAAGEFTGTLGSDSLFAFRRDSLYSGLAGMGIRGTDAIQYQFALTTGSAPPQNLMGSLSYTRDSIYSSSSTFQPSVPGSNSQAINVDREQLDMDPTGQALSTSSTITGLDSGSMMGTLRSSSTYNTTSTLQPSLLSVYTQGIDQQPVGLVASPLLGITPTPLVDTNRDPNPLVARPPNADTDPTVPGGLPSTRVTTSYDELVDQMRERVQTMRDEKLQAGTSTTIQPGETNDAWLTRQMDEIRKKLYLDTAETETDESTTDPADPSSTDPTQTDEEAASGSDVPPLVSVPDATDSPLAQKLEESQERLEQINQDFQLYDPTEVAIDPETLEVLRGNAANEVKHLLDPNAQSRDLYAEHILAGQRLIEAGRFYDAEERFTHALSLKPRDVIAQQGRLHAQIGAGMLLSASVNLQTLYSENPELITTRYAEGIMPGAERVKLLKQRLGERAGIIEPEIRTRHLEGDRVRVSAGLLLAYIGYQSQDQESIDAGLGMAKQLGTDSDRRFVSLLEQLWAIPATQP